MSATRLLILGIIRQEPAHGYVVVRELKDWQAETWTSIKPGSVYHAISALERQGFLQSVGVESSADGPSRTVYKTTQAGESEFFQLLGAALVDPDTEYFTAGLAFMNQLTRRQVLGFLKDRLNSLKAIQEFLATLPADESLKNPGQNPEIVGHWHMFFKDAAEWTRALIERIKSGKYAFADDLN